MANVFEYDGFKPVIHETAFIHPSASIIGNVIIGKDVYIGPCCSIRGDIGEIIIEDFCNVQDGCVVHMFPGVTVTLKEYAHIGHGAIVHGAFIGRNVLVGMNAVVMDNVTVGDNSIIGAMSFVPEDMIIPGKKLVVGNPAKIIKDIPDLMVEWKKKATNVYVETAIECMKSFAPCEPLREIPNNRKKQIATLPTWKEYRERHSG